MMYAMARIFKAEMNRLRREESGVALMLTLSVVLLLYVLCAGIYAVGETARQKIEIQNACDAAAYSAALVEADGLSRMAMVNRALAWTYITLTNMQIDYLTYKWLQLVEGRFSDDKTMCAEQAGKSSYRGWGGSECPECDALKQQDVGWFCGVAGAGTDYVRLNGSQTPVPISVIQETLQNMQHIEADYPQCILLFKESIRLYNGCLLDVARKMNKAIPQTAMAVLRQNLPRLSPGGLDERARDDFFGYCHCPTFFTPYEEIEVEGGNAVVGNVMSPLYNTELDERLFLSMADGEVHDNLADYFGPSGDEDKRFGGLDQWFVRSHADETKTNAAFVARTADSYRALGICRVYKNANRIGDEPLPAYRAHHWRLGRDSRPSCINTRSYCPDQCREAPDTVAPYAEYEWCAGRYKYRCYHLHVPAWPRDIDIHFHFFDGKFLRTCDVHGCQGCLPSDSHTRSAYKSCVSTKKSLRVIEPFSGSESVSWPPVYPGQIDPHWWTTRTTVQLSVTTKPNGFARIYGDDWEICNTNTFEYYTGEVAMPWILNDKYYSGGGSIVVGLARRQRNPWSVLLNGFSPEAASPSATAEGIYSAFDPVADGYLVAFSAARAAHRFNPSLQQKERYGVAKAPAGEYETRYDAVCDDALDASGALGRFNIRQDDGDLLKSRVGCVCKDVDNERRFARCWNLCETDWDATLLPLKYSGFGLSTEWHDSLSGPSEVWWATEAALGDTGRNAFALAALDDDEGRPKWIPFTEDGDRLSGRFLSLAAPPRPGTDVVPSPSMQDILPDATSAESPADDPSPYDTPDDGHLDVKTLIRTRIL